MKIPVELKITQAHLETLYSYLYPGDEYEAVAIALCGRRKGAKHALLVQDIASVPMNAYKVRSSTTVEWETEWMIPLLEKAETEHLAILKIHSHPGGHREFSLYDDASDNKLFPSIHGWTDDGLPRLGAFYLIQQSRVRGCSLIKKYRSVTFTWQIDVPSSKIPDR